MEKKFEVLLGVFARNNFALNKSFYIPVDCHGILCCFVFVEFLAVLFRLMFPSVMSATVNL